MGKIKSLFTRRIRSKSQSQSHPESTSTSPTTTSGELITSTTASDLEQVFKRFDSNGDGKISSDELSAIFTSLGHPPTGDELSQMMAEADSDGDGFISLEEFIDLNTINGEMIIEDLKHAFSVFDLDRNGEISAEELARVMRSLGEKVSIEKCKKMIEGVDKNGDGSVSFEEFKMMMMSGNGFGGENKKD